jgi:hypothetical protein
LEWWLNGFSRGESTPGQNVWSTRYWWPSHENSLDWFPSSPLYAFRGTYIIDFYSCLLDGIRILIDNGFLIQGTPAGARNIPLLVLFSPLFLLQGAGVLFAASKLAEKRVLLLRSEAGTGRYFTFSSRAHDCLGFLHHGSR